MGQLQVQYDVAVNPVGLYPGKQLVPRTSTRRTRQRYS